MNNQQPDIQTTNNSGTYKALASSLLVRVILWCIILGSIITILVVGGISIFSGKAEDTQNYIPDIPNLVQRIQPSVVYISTYNKGRLLAQGTGFFVSATGEIATNRHVMESADTATITTVDGKEYNISGIIAEDSAVDVVKVIATVPIGVSVPITLSNTPPQVGEKVIVIGNPLGLEQSVSDGIVSAVRSVPEFGNVVQITAPISPGSSGSPVVNMRGEVIGIATMVVKEGQNLNFAIPSARIAAVPSGLNRGFIIRDSDVCLDRGLMLHGSEAQAREAIEEFKKSIQLNPYNSKAFVALGMEYGSFHQYQEAIDAFQQAIRLDPNYAVAYSGLAITYLHTGNRRAAFRTYQELKTLNPEMAEDLYSTYPELSEYLREMMYQ